MQVSHTPAAVSVSFDEPNLLGSAGLVPMMELAAEAGLHELTGQRLTVPTDQGANAGTKVAALVAGMCAGADSIDGMVVLRHGAMKQVFTGCYAPSTLGSFLRSFTFGHVRQLDAVACRLLASLADRAPLLGAPGAGRFVYVDVDDTIIDIPLTRTSGTNWGYLPARAVLRSKSPALVYQEVWGHLCCHYAIRTLMADAAQAAGRDPDRVSFVAALSVTRRSLAHQGDFCPSVP